MVDDLLLHKVSAIERAVLRVEALGAGEGAYSGTRLDAVVLSLQRACDGAVDAAMHLVRVHRLGVPQDTADAFDLLERAALLPPALSGRMRGIVQMRGTLTHDYESLAPEDIRRMVEAHLQDFPAFTAHAIGLALPGVGAAGRPGTRAT
jgi:uncharacterized protein YutE (UPF0331/DUF86 family)